MTCIVGLVHKKKVYIGADSLGTNSANLNCTVRSDPKVFKNGPFIIGFTSSFRMGQILHMTWVPPEHPAGISDYEFMVAHVMPSIINVFQDQKYGGVDSEKGAIGGTFLMAYKHVLYEINSDFQVGIPKDGIAACGSGGSVALGSLYTSTGNPKKRIIKALQVAEHLNAGVRGPFKAIVEK